jgi:antirestriction protein ArdC
LWRETRMFQLEPGDYGGEIADISPAADHFIGFGARAPSPDESYLPGPETPNLYDKVTGAIIRQLEEGTPPWLKPWAEGATGAAGLPFNASSGRAYGGINTLLLWAESAHRGYDGSGWLTLKQIKEAGGNLAKIAEDPCRPSYTGQQGTMIVYYGTSTREKTRDDGKRDDGRYRFLKRFWVYNTDQCENLPAKFGQPPTPVPEIEDGLIASNAFVAKLGANIIYQGAQAFYRPSSDIVVMPRSSAFAKKAKGDLVAAAGLMQATRFHELTHWTGADHRLKRDLRNSFGSDKYAREELVAEIGAAFLCAEFGIPAILHHASYLAHWLKVLREDSRAIFSAAAAAKRAVDFMHQVADDAITEAAE